MPTYNSNRAAIAALCMYLHLVLQYHGDFISLAVHALWRLNSDSLALVPTGRKSKPGGDD